MFAGLEQSEDGEDKKVLKSGDANTKNKSSADDDESSSTCFLKGLDIQLKIRFFPAKIDSEKTENTKKGDNAEPAETSSGNIQMDLEQNFQEWMS